MSNWKYRLKKGARKHKGQDKWEHCDNETKLRIEKSSPGRFEFEQDIEAVTPPIAIVEKPKRGRPKKENTEDK